MKYGIVIFPGSNCDRDSYHAIKQCSQSKVAMIWHNNNSLVGFDCIILPGGFSYGDYLRAGAIARFSPIMKRVIDFANNGGLVVGICNGFQILLEVNLLPGIMLQNRDIHFICKNVYIKTLSNKTPFTSKISINQVLNIPIAHMDGNYFCDADTYNMLEKNDQVIFKYCDIDGNIGLDFNPNGSVGNIAGICNENKNVFGLMPHPERAVDRLLGSTDGINIFNSIDSHYMQA